MAGPYHPYQTPASPDPFSDTAAPSNFSSTRPSRASSTHAAANPFGTPRASSEDVSYRPARQPPPRPPRPGRPYPNSQAPADQITAIPPLRPGTRERPLPIPHEKPLAPAPSNESNPGAWKRISGRFRRSQQPSEPTLPVWNEKASTPAPATTTGAADEKRGLGRRFKDEFVKNYCPREAPPIILPTIPTDKEKYSYIKMNRTPLLICGLFSLLALSAGAWLFIKASPWYAWYAVYAILSEFYLFTSYGITFFGKRFDLEGHNKILRENPLTEQTAPTVDIFLPVCKEPIEILENTWKYVSAMRYPAGKMQAWVLDDGAQQEVGDLARRFGFQYIVRPNRPELKKAGNMRYAFSQTSGAFFVVFDADFCPRADFLEEMMPEHMADPKMAILQTPQFFHSLGEQTWVEQGAGSVQEYFYRIVQPCRNTWGGAICVGSNAMYRREALEAVGGTAPADCSEDVHTGFYAVTRGWKVRYMPLALACGVCPDTPRAFFSQQMRWCTGSLSLLTHRDFWKSPLSAMQKFCYLTGFFYYSTTAFAVFLNPIPAPLLLWTHPEMFKFYNLFFAFPSVILGVLALRWWARSRYTLTVQYCQVVMGYAYLHAIWDRFFGTKMSWLPTGDAKAHKNNRYRNMRILAWCWTIVHNIVLVTGSVYHITFKGMAWYHVVPALALDAFNLLCVHRFLLYNHAEA